MIPVATAARMTVSNKTVFICLKKLVRMGSIHHSQIGLRAETQSALTSVRVRNTFGISFARRVRFRRKSKALN